MLNTTTLEIWPIKVRQILSDKKICVKDLENTYENIYFPWTIDKKENYNGLRNYYSLRIQQRPLFIIRPICTTDLENILDYCLLKNLTLRICNGRHSSQLCESEVLVDTTLFKDIKLEGEVLTVGGGVTQGQANDFLFKESNVEHYSHFGRFDKTFAYPGGSAASVGVGGISTAGGVGTLGRTYGLTIDSIISFKITIPPTLENSSKCEILLKSRTIIASKKEHSNLFWALKGCPASNYGIISEIKYDIIEVPEVIEYSIDWDWNVAEEKLKLWRDTSITRSKEYNEDVSLYITEEPLVKKECHVVQEKLCRDTSITESKEDILINITEESLGGKKCHNPKEKLWKDTSITGSNENNEGKLINITKEPLGRKECHNPKEKLWKDTSINITEEPLVKKECHNHKEKICRDISINIIEESLVKKECHNPKEKLRKDPLSKKKCHIHLSGIYVNINNLSKEECNKQITKTVSYLGGVLIITPSTKYSSLYKTLVKNRAYNNFSIIQPFFTDYFNTEVIIKHIERGIKLKGQVSISFQLLGGTIKDVSSKSASFYPRNKNFFVDVASSWNEMSNTASTENWTEDIVTYFIKKENYAYVGFPITFSNITNSKKFSSEIYFGSNNEYLKILREYYDPFGILKKCGTL